jgi:hemerythrin-like domain-containing protein
MGGAMKHDTGTRARREFLAGGAALAASAAAIGAGRAFAAESAKTEVKAAPPADAAPEVSTLEDLMREHGALRRILMIYDEVAARVNQQKDFPVEAVVQSAGIVRRFVEDYHEKLEEDFIFPRFEKAGKLVELTRALRSQHEAGRFLTGQILRQAEASQLKSRAQQRRLGRTLRSVIRMYQPHAAREETVLFPAFHTIISAREYDELGDRFEDREHELFGEQGFEKIVAEIAEMEKTLGIYDLAQFTPAP